jgi:general secretion pathway protein E
MTGHLVFSTLHTNDSAGALTRLVDMGVEPFLIASSLVGVMAQRLVRRICGSCKKTFQPDDSFFKNYGLPKKRKYYIGKGCPECMETGFKNRTGIFELLIVDPDIRNLVKTGADSVTIKEKAVEKGMTTLFEDGLQKIRAGITTIDEVMRVSQE